MKGAAVVWDGGRRSAVSCCAPTMALASAVAVSDTRDTLADVSDVLRWPGQRVTAGCERDAKSNTR